MALGPQDVGSRVVVRRVLRGEHGPSGGPAFADVIGVLEEWDEETLAVRHRDGSLVRVERAAVVAAKTVPPPPARPHRRT